MNFAVPVGVEEGKHFRRMGVHPGLPCSADPGPDEGKPVDQPVGEGGRRIRRRHGDDPQVGFAKDPVIPGPPADMVPHGVPRFIRRDGRMGVKGCNGFGADGFLSHLDQTAVIHSEHKVRPLHGDRARRPLKIDIVEVIQATGPEVTLFKTRSDIFTLKRLG